MAGTSTRKPLGSSGLNVSPLAFGGNVFGWTADEATSFDMLDMFVASGFNLIDTANIYSAWVPGHQGGESETVIGNWLKISGKRDHVVIATKVGMKMGDGTQGLKKEYILQCAEASLKRLQIDTIDLYQSHQDDPETPLDETLGAYDILIKQGKVRAIGASNYSAQRLQAAKQISEQHNLPSFVSLQPEYNLFAREDFEKELEPWCLQNNVGVISYFSLASGFLTGKYRSEADLHKSARGKGIGGKYLNERGHAILAGLDEVAADHNVTPTPIALAWLMQRKSVTAPIVSATSTEQLAQVLKAVEIKLTAAQVKVLDDASAY